MKRTDFSHMCCSVARSLDLIGEWWSLLIVRDIFLGMRRFEELRQDLGISRKVLTERLETLISAEILERRRYHERPERYEYWLTEKGTELFPVLLVLMQWGDRWTAQNGVPREIIHTTCGKLTQPVVVCAHCGTELNAHNIHTRPGSGSITDCLQATPPSIT
ncbi:MAG: helix-turn-helix transcriptional regulator [Scytonema hyalinum WJT4-NPBG1]|nr:helix-turn-helix transcriptional regulator [Scytonema hyalinum WJT4-NPBG1]